MPIKEIIEIRILPPFAIGRLGSSPEPMDNYELHLSDTVGYRKIVPAETFHVDIKTGKIVSQRKPESVRFRDAKNRIRPISPFLEVWARFEKKGQLVPLTVHHLKQLGLTASSITWRVIVGNIKAFRRTKDPNDKILADTREFNDFLIKKLKGECKNFLPGKSIPLGFAQFIKPSIHFPEIRLRFTPASGFVYGPPLTNAEKKANGVQKEFHSSLKDVVYDPKKGKWKGHIDRGPTTTSPGSIFANDRTAKAISLGYLDDECDGIVELVLDLKTKKLTTFSRMLAGPPTFVPDGVPIRTVGDDLEQALLGPEMTGKINQGEIENIVRRALETVRMINTKVMNFEDGMAGMDTSYNRAFTPIMNPNVVDNLAIRARHELVLTALESGALAWFARVVREYDQVADLTDEGRRKMPALMRGADGNHLALTRRMIDKIKKAADMFNKKKVIPLDERKNKL